MYIGVQLKEKQSWWKKIKNNVMDVVKGDKSISQGMKGVNQSILDESKIYRKGYSTIKGSIKRVQKTIHDLKNNSNGPTPIKKIHLKNL